MVFPCFARAFKVSRGFLLQVGLLVLGWKAITEPCSETHELFGAQYMFVVQVPHCDTGGADIWKAASLLGRQSGLIPLASVRGREQAETDVFA